MMAMADLAKYSGTGAVPLTAIAQRQRISLAYLEQLFGRLRRAGLVESERGRSGGYVLARPASAISVAAVMHAVEEAVEMTRCAGSAEHELGCLGHERCLTHDLWQALGDNIRDFLDDISIADVIGGRVKSTRAAPSAARLAAE